jgi:hypothetical protein
MGLPPWLNMCSRRYALLAEDQVGAADGPAFSFSWSTSLLVCPFCQVSLSLTPQTGKVTHVTTKTWVGSAGLGANVGCGVGVALGGVGAEQQEIRAAGTGPGGGAGGGLLRAAGALWVRSLGGHWPVWVQSSSSARARSGSNALLV